MATNGPFTISGGVAANGHTFNDASRDVLGKLDIYFDGPGNSPVTVLDSDYLMDFHLTEEISAESDNPLGSISANEITFNLSNFDKRFSPSNTTGPYYGKILPGMKVVPWIAINDTSVTWIQMGVFYVTNWDAKLGSGVSSVTCTDIIQTLFGAPIPSIDIQTNVTFNAFITSVLTAYGFGTMSVSSSLSTVVPYAVVVGANTADFLKELCRGARANLFSDRAGNPKALKLAAATPVATWTDSDQIKTITIPQSSLKDYGGVNLTYALPWIADESELLTIDSLALASGVNSLSTIPYNGQIYAISSVIIAGMIDASVTAYAANNFGISMSITAASAGSVRIRVIGRTVVVTEQVLADAVSNMLIVSNQYVQTAAYAASYKTALNTLMSVAVPELTLSIRGNPTIQLGDTITVSSTKLAVSFTGVVKRMVYIFDGGLSCEATLINTGVLS